MPWKKYITIEQLPDDYQLIAGAIGLENAIKLAQALPKIYIYLSSPAKIFKPAKVKYILERFSKANPEAPFNYRHIALETGLSLREVYDIIEQRQEKSRQQHLFTD